MNTKLWLNKLGYDVLDSRGRVVAEVMDDPLLDSVKVALWEYPDSNYRSKWLSWPRKVSVLGRMVKNPVPGSAALLSLVREHGSLTS